MNAPLPTLSDLVVERVGFGIFVLDRQMNVLMWNRFMHDHSGLSAQQVVGKSIFASFPELPRVWLTRKLESVFQLGSFAFSSWEQRPYLFKFDHDRPITGGVDFMQQDCTFMPIMREREVEAVCVTVSDVTHVSIMQREREEAVAKLQEYADRDGLTGIANRRYFEARLRDEYTRWQRYGGDLSILLFDLDHFKKINDQFGHVVGDTVLRDMAQRVSHVVRAQDTFGRFGGEEFALLLPCTPLEDAMLVAEKIRNTIGDKPVDVQGVDVPVTASVGGASARAGVPAYEALINEADAALYSAKRQGRNRSVAFI
ncbi:MULTISPECIES: GGDEF domain-containing protein [Paraburkholderia]|jgi:diguanylate cyclase (GGDEF)-like protein|uniref:diguanylate cyclase n=1 Tax=Paraburkholderia caribensis TaxID=75105 RepID=A0A9Q6S4X1_9BURK|nr:MULTISPECIES: diguanylate cyclase [Paraburkholderia]ALP65263.1 diguanylate cyclase [Paraburkholderia caribensis]AUT53583.1 sensor domain-containing diguanylate cyclase [Paraburkholderia caribensis]MCO4877556.1 diguanylate cyclase [Paraburkholderia caribensis]PTB26817.1 sensor domain-containing diguanylate cyclase [Paraburkholderia caribensis]QLB65242.1 diguanylate cyclase [Paraburkholderia caribensis]